MRPRYSLSQHPNCDSYKIYYLIKHTRSLSQQVLSMDITTHSHENTRENLLVIDNSGRILSRRVSQLYGTVLLRAIVHSERLQDVHHTSLLQTEPWTLENIKEDVQAISPRDNFIFVDDSRRILSCRINPDNGIALLESLPQNPTEVADYAEAALSHNPTIQSSEASSSKQGTGAQSSQRPPTQSKPLYTDSSFPLSNTSATPTAKARILSDQVLSTINRQPYDRDWMSKYNIDDSCLNGTSSEIKLDVLFKHGAIKAGDLLGVRYELDDGSAYIEVGQVLQPLRDPQDPYRSRLDLRVLTHQAGIDGILYNCKDATGIIDGMDREFQNTSGESEELSEPWKMIDVFEGDGREVGSLWRVRQAYEVFTKTVTEWGEWNKEATD
ncbi:hypothetical protein BDR22DRAFT_912186 [Usnea florida]